MVLTSHKNGDSSILSSKREIVYGDYYSIKAISTKKGCGLHGTKCFPISSYFHQLFQSL